MSVAVPHFLLFSESSRERASGRRRAGQWRFVLEALDGSSTLVAADEEPQVAGNRLELLAVVRGLEALDQPSRVTLVTPSKYVSRGIRYGLDVWRDNGWRWERFGKLAPVKNGDLWRRVDRALRYHKVDCRTWRFDRTDDDLARPAGARPAVATAPRPGRDGCSRPRPRAFASRLIRRLGAICRRSGWWGGEPAWAAAG